MFGFSSKLIALNNAPYMYDLYIRVFTLNYSTTMVVNPNEYCIMNPCNNCQEKATDGVASSMKNGRAQSDKTATRTCDQPGDISSLLTTCSGYYVSIS